MEKKNLATIIDDLCNYYLSQGSSYNDNFSDHNLALAVGKKYPIEEVEVTYYYYEEKQYSKGWVNFKKVFIEPSKFEEEIKFRHPRSWQNYSLKEMTGKKYQLEESFKEKLQAKIKEIIQLTNLRTKIVVDEMEQD